jgi:hypothetical protein
MSPLYLVLMVLVVGVGILGIILMIKSQGDQARARRLSIIAGHGAVRNDVSDKTVKDRRLADLSKKLKQTQGG